jgi:hypothetical protein
MLIPIDRAQWSKSDQINGARFYDNRAKFYGSIAYRCWKCETPCVFTAEAQKNAYEIQKKNSSWFPSLCSTCQVELEKFRVQDCECQSQWNENRDDLKNNLEFLQRWLTITKVLISCKKGNPDVVKMLARRIAELSAAKSL